MQAARSEAASGKIVRPGIEHFAGGVLTAMTAAHAALSNGDPHALRFWIAEAHRQEIEVQIRLMHLGLELDALPSEET